MKTWTKNLTKIALATSLVAMATGAIAEEKNENRFHRKTA